MNAEPDVKAFSSGTRFLVALAFGLTVAVGAYAAVRTIDIVLFPEPNPIVIIWTDRSRFIWRGLIASYLGGAAVFGGYRLACETPERSVAWLERSIYIAGACLALQTIFGP